MNHWMTRLLVGKVDMSIISTEDSPWCTPWLTGNWKPIIFLSIRRGPPVHVHHWHWCRRYITVLVLTASKTAKVVNTRSTDSIPPGPLIGPFRCRRVWRSVYPARFCVPVYPSSVQDGIYALGKARMRSTLSVRSFPIVAFETVPMSVRQYRLALPLSTPLSSRWSMVCCPRLCSRR